MNIPNIGVILQASVKAGTPTFDIGIAASVAGHFSRRWCSYFN